MIRYQLVSEDQISKTEECTTCGGWWHIALRKYKDLENTHDDNLLEISVRTACTCTEENDAYKKYNESQEMKLVDLNKRWTGRSPGIIDYKSLEREKKRGKMF